MSAEERTTSSTGGQKGVKLERFDLIPVGPLTELARHYGVGARKYANHQWRQGYEWSKSYAAMMRHLTLFWAGEDYDVCPADQVGCKDIDDEGNLLPQSTGTTCYNHTGSHHMAAVAWHAFLLLEFKDRYPEHDDRYRPPTPEPKPFDYQVFIPRARFVQAEDVSTELIQMLVGLPIEPTFEVTFTGEASRVDAVGGDQ